MILTPEALLRARHGVWSERLEILEIRFASHEENPGSTPIKEELLTVVARLEEVEHLASKLGIELVRLPRKTGLTLWKP